MMVIGRPIAHAAAQLGFRRPLSAVSTIYFVLLLASLPGQKFGGSKESFLTPVDVYYAQSAAFEPPNPRLGQLPLQGCANLLGVEIGPGFAN